jgi:3-phosphoglycerate kinase
MNVDQWDEMYRKFSVLDIPLEGKNLLVRLDLNVPLSDYVPPSVEEGEDDDEENKLNKS